MNIRVFRVFLIFMMAVAASACGFLDDEIDNRIPEFPPILFGPDGATFDGQSLGASCDAEDTCRRGLTCTAGTCEAAGNLGNGDICAISAECGDGLVCDTLSARCLASEGGEIGAACLSGTACAPGLRCEIIGFNGFCSEDVGTQDIGGACETNSECFAPLLCSDDDICKLPAFGGVLPLQGAECPRGQDGDGPFRVLFEVPRGEPLDEFFALPFPNNIRLTSTGIDMSGFYNPGTKVLGGEFFDAFVSSAGAGLTGFSPSATVYLRLSKPFNLGDVTGSGDNPTLFYRNISPSSDTYNNSPQSWSWSLSTGRGNFICYNAIKARANWNFPRTEGETYAVWVTTNVGEDADTAGGSQTVAQDSDFAAMLASSEPSDAVLAAAWQTYQPFRDYLTAEGISPSTIAGAAVFTVGTPSQAVEPLRAAVQTESNFALDNLTLCDGSNTSPCDDGADRGCLNAETGYIELHAKYKAPVFQQGTRPYLRAADGGTINVNGAGVATTNGTEDICVSFAIPADVDMPAAGWPTIMYAHGTGGSFTSHLQPAVAGALTNATSGSQSARFVTVGIDGVMHGPRRGDSDLDPDVLFFNPLNPEAARANGLQGAADYFYLTRLLQNVSVAAVDSPTNDAIRFDSDSLYFYGHSQGSNVGTLFASAEPDIQAAVLSGAGGSLVLSLLNKTSPQDIPSILPIVLGETNIDDRHPFLNLVQQWIDAADPLNYGRLIYAQSNEDTMGRDVLQTYGVGDTFTPPPAMQALGGASQFGLLQPPIDEIGGMPGVTGPVSGNKNGTTALMIQYQPDGYDGHFVAFRNSDAVKDIVQFFVTNLNDGVATVR